MKKFEVYGTLATDCTMVIEANNKEEAMKIANNVNWDEWDNVEPNNLDVYTAYETLDSMISSHRNNCNCNYETE